MNPAFMVMTAREPTNAITRFTMFLPRTAIIIIMGTGTEVAVKALTSPSLIHHLLKPEQPCVALVFLFLCGE
jgi:hypothetical protein